MMAAFHLRQQPASFERRFPLTKSASTFPNNNASASLIAHITA